MTVDVPFVLAVPPGNSALTLPQHRWKTLRKNYMHFLKHRGVLPVRWQTPHIEKRWVFVCGLQSLIMKLLNLLKSELAQLCRWATFLLYPGKDKLHAVHAEPEGCRHEMNWLLIIEARRGQGIDPPT
jgi:hypothetical protein